MHCTPFVAPTSTWQRCIGVVASTCCSTAAFDLLLLPATALLDLPYCSHLLQRHCICYVAPTCCNTSASDLLRPSTTAPLCLIYVAPTCCNTTASSLLPPLAATPLDLPYCFYLLQYHCNLLCYSHLLQHDAILPASTCRSSTISSLLLPFAPTLLHLCCLDLYCSNTSCVVLLLLQHYCICFAAITSSIRCMTIVSARRSPPIGALYGAPLHLLCCFHPL